MKPLVCGEDDRIEATILVDGKPVAKVIGNPFFVMHEAAQYASQYREEGNVTLETRKIS